MKLKVKIHDKKYVMKDIKEYLASSYFPKLNLVSKLKSGGTPILLDLSYSTILGYDKQALYKTMEVFTDNLKDIRINDIFKTDYTLEQLDTASMNILSKSLKLVQKSVYDTDLTEPSFIDIAVTFKAELVIN